MEIDISIVVPLYNEEESILLLYSSITGVLERFGRSYEIIFVDDGSRDKTFELACGLHERDGHVGVVKFRRNYGQTPAMQAGFDYAKGKIIISMDGDLQNDPEDIPNFVKKIEEGYDIVCGWRKDRQDAFITRKIPSMAANWLISVITNIKIHDNGCSLKAYRRHVIKNTRLYAEMHRFIPAMTSINGAKYAEIVVRHHARQFGKSKYGLSRIWKVFLDLFLIKMLISFSSKPALWFFICSLPFLFLSAFFLIFSVKFIMEEMNGDSSMIISTASFLWLSLSSHLFLLGMLSEIIIRTGNIEKITIELGEGGKNFL